MITQRGRVRDDLYQVISREEISCKLNKCKSPEACYEEICKYVKEITIEEFLNNMRILYACIQENDEECILEDEELENITGGVSGEEVCAIVSAGAAIAASSAV